MRYIGNKTKLIPFIGRALDRLGIETGSACDPFAGTAAVASFLKERGFHVVSGDILSFSYALQRAYVVVDDPPEFRGLPRSIAGADDRLGAVIRHLNRLEPRPEFVHDHFSPGGRAARRHGRRYFTAENAALIDAARRRIHEWRLDERVTRDEACVLLTALLEAADRVANTTGIYAAYVKSWQPNARRPLRLRPPKLVTGTGRRCRACRIDALALVRRLPPFDLLYLDPPYNTRQYAGYYHVPELIAEGWFDGRPRLRGKTGLPPDGHKRSDWSRRRRCELAFERLIRTARCRHILLSYNSEGIIPEKTIERVLKERGRPETYRRLAKRYKRYRSDRDGPGRRYRGDRVTERLYYVRVDPD